MADRALDDREIVSILTGKIQNAVGFQGGRLSGNRQKADRYYNGDLFGNEVEGRSQVVSRDVAEAVDSMMPSLMKIFFSGDQVVQFDPTGPEDEDGAKQATDYVNWIFIQQNSGYQIGHTWFKDALLKKNSIVKVWWDKSVKTEREEYSDLTENQYMMLMSDPDLELKEHTVKPDPSGMVSQPGMVAPQLHDAVFTRKHDASQIRIVPVPGDEFLIERRSVDLDEVSFTAHRLRLTQSDLIKMYPDKRAVIEMLPEDEAGEYQQERLQRFAADDEYPFRDNGAIDQSQRMLWLTECYCKMDANGDGIAEMMQIVIAGDQSGQAEILDKQEVDDHPFAALCPIPMPHKFYGMSIADQTMDLQLIKSTIWRQLLDNMYLTNAPQMGVIEGQVNLDDALNRRPGGLIRMKSPDALFPVPQQSVLGDGMSMMAYVDSVREQRTGVQKFAPGPGSDALHNAYNSTATGASIVETASQERLELIARNFAETGVKKLFRRILELVCKHQERAKIIRLNGKWVEMDPRNWNSGMDLTVSVGLGTGNKQQQIGTIMNLLQLDRELISGPPQFAAMVSPQNVFHKIKKLVEASGLKSVDAYYTDPANAPPPPPAGPHQDPKAMAEMARVQQEPQIAQMKAEIDSRTRIQVAHINAAAAIEAARVKAMADNGAAAYAAEIAAQQALATAHLDNHAAMALQATAPQPEPTAPQ